MKKDVAFYSGDALSFEIASFQGCHRRATYSFSYSKPFVRVLPDFIP